MTREEEIREAAYKHDSKHRVYSGCVMGKGLSNRLPKGGVQ